MKTFIYKGHKKQGSYLYIEHENDFSRIPQDLLSILGKLSQVMVIELGAGKKLAQADVQQVMKALSENGYYLQMSAETEKLALAGIKVKSNPIPSL